MVIDLSTARLYYVDIFTPHGLFDLYTGFPNCELG